MKLAPDFRFGSYVVIELLGVGLHGEVYRCRDTVRGREVALKILQPESGRQDEMLVAQFHQEAQITNSIRHLNIIEVYDSGIENEVHYIISEFLDGRPLSGPLHARELTLIAAQIAAGITALHNVGIVHNDIKPKNLILTTDGRVKIIDFGIAQKFTSEMLTDAQTLIEWNRRVRLDQLSFGLSLYELASGKAPFEDPQSAHILSELLGSQLLSLPSEIQCSMQDAMRRCAAEGGSYAGLLLTAMSVAVSLAGAPLPKL